METRIVASLLVLASVAGAHTSPPSDSNRKLADHLNAMDSARDASMRTEPRVGMTVDQVRQVLEAIGNKDVAYTIRIRWSGTCEVNSMIVAKSIEEEWVCGEEGYRSYLYFEDRVLKAIQER